MDLRLEPGGICKTLQYACDEDEETLCSVHMLPLTWSLAGRDCCL